MNEQAYQDRIRELEQALRYAGECSTLGMVRDTVRGAGVLDAPASGVIIKPVAWHPGGAQINKATGKPYPWPWEGAKKSPKLWVKCVIDDRAGNLELTPLTWRVVVYWCNPDDLEPPAIG